MEDDVVLGDVTKEILDTQGHASTLARTVDDAFALLSVDHVFAVILLDLQVGAERGETVIMRLRAGNHRVPAVVLLSAQPIPDLQHAARQVGAVGFLQKPCSVEKLLNALQGIASASSSSIAPKPG